MAETLDKVLVGGDDGSGDASFWEHIRDQVQQPESSRLFSLAAKDVGRTAILGGRDTVDGLDTAFATNRVAYVLRRVGPKTDARGTSLAKMVTGRYFYPGKTGANR